jgi:hypothetical protein
MRRHALAMRWQSLPRRALGVAVACTASFPPNSAAAVADRDTKPPTQREPARHGHGARLAQTNVHVLHLSIRVSVCSQSAFSLPAPPAGFLFPPLLLRGVPTALCV